MKIQGQHVPQVGGSSPDDPVQRKPAGRGESAAAHRPEDTLSVSAKARIVTTAVKAAEEAPDVRADVVKRLQAQMASGDLGRDVGRLADHIIDHLLDETGRG